MIILDENIPESQRQQMRERRIRVHQIGEQIGRKVLQDSEIISPTVNSRKGVAVLRLPCYNCIDVQTNSMRLRFKAHVYLNVKIISGALKNHE